jgi:hypothetical protein
MVPSPALPHFFVLLLVFPSLPLCAEAIIRNIDNQAEAAPIFPISPNLGHDVVRARGDYQ